MTDDPGETPAGMAPGAGDPLGVVVVAFRELGGFAQARVIEGEAVIVTPEDSMLHTLNPVGTFIWERADGAHSLDAIVDELCAEYEVERAQALADALAFVATCVERKVLTLSDQPLPQPLV